MRKIVRNEICGCIGCILLKFSQADDETKYSTTLAKQQLICHNKPIVGTNNIHDDVREIFKLILIHMRTNRTSFNNDCSSICEQFFGKIMNETTCSTCALKRSNIEEFYNILTIPSNSVSKMITEFFCHRINKN